MAKEAEPKRTETGRSKYDWQKLMTGTWWLLERGVDYTVEDNAMRRAAYHHGKTIGVRVETRAGDDGLYVKFHVSLTAASVSRINEALNSKQGKRLKRRINLPRTKKG